MSNQHKQQQKLAKKRKQREQAKKEARKAAVAKPAPELNYLARASQYPPGPCFLSEGYDDLRAPALVVALVSRVVPNGRVVFGMLFVDRACLGVKDATVHVTESVETLRAHADEISSDQPLVEVPFARVASLVHAALDYAAGLGFAPHRDFLPGLLEPRPVPLEETPWAKPERPLYVQGPEDDAARILAQLTQRLGPEGFDHHTEGHSSFSFAPSMPSDESDDEEESPEVAAALAELDAALDAEERDREEEA